MNDAKLDYYPGASPSVINGHFRESCKKNQLGYLSALDHFILVEI